MSGEPGGEGPEPSCPEAGTAIAHAWYALEPEDELLLLEHLPSCPICRHAVRDAEAVGAELARAVPVHEPPVALRERILAEVRPAPAPVRRIRAGALLVAAAVVLGVALLGGRALLPAEPTSPDDRAAAVVDEAVAADPGVRHAVLRDPAGRALAVVLDAPTDDRARMVPVGLDPPQAGRSWVLWGTGGDAGPAPLGVVDPATGRSSGTVARAPTGGWRGYAVSLEPGDRAPARPSQVLALGAVT